MRPDLLALRKDSNLTLATVLWGNVTVNVLLTLLSDSVLAGIGAFAFSTIVITLFGEIFPQAYFSRNALRMAARFSPLLRVYEVALFPIAKPTAIILNWWLGPEGITFLRERDFRALITRHAGAAGADVSHLEALGALNFLDLDDILVADEGELVDPRSIITLPFANERPVLPKFAAFARRSVLARFECLRKKVGHHRRRFGPAVIRAGCAPFSARCALQRSFRRPGNLLASSDHHHGYAHPFGQRDRPHEGEGGTSRGRCHRQRSDPGLGPPKTHHHRSRSFGTALAWNSDAGCKSK